MKNSIQLKLTFAFTALFTLVAGVAGGMSFYDTYRETYKLQDEMLVQLARFIDTTQTTTLKSSRDNDARVYVHFEHNGEGADKMPPNFPQ